MQRPTGLSVLIALALAGPAHAGGEDEAKALFERGRELVKAGNNAEACPLFEHSLQLAPALGTELNLAICWAAVGRLVDAQRLFEALVGETAAADQPQRLQLAREGLEGVKARLPHLKIDATALPAGDAIVVDGKPVDAAQPVAVDPGHHAIRAAHGLPVDLEIAEGRLAEVTLEAAAARPRPMRLWYLGGAAAGALVISAVTGLAVIRERDSALHHCTTATPDGALACDPRGLDLLDRAHAMSHVSTGFLVAGAALGAFTAVLELKWRHSKEAPIATAWSAPHAAGVALETVW